MLVFFFCLRGLRRAGSGQAARRRTVPWFHTFEPNIMPGITALIPLRETPMPSLSHDLTSSIASYPASGIRHM
jgi:hypothetical protein